LLKIYGGHGVHLNQPGLLTGQFSGHFENVCFAFADEAFWAGDKAGRGTLYTMITEPELMIHPKFFTPFRAKNHLKFIIAGNAEWLVPAGQDARRWAVFDVSEARKGDHAYFEALVNETDNGGAEAMFHELSSLDLEGWHPRKGVPQTEALMQQKLKSLDPAGDWILNLLETGELPGLKLAPNMASATALRDDLESSARMYITHRTVPVLLKRWGCRPWKTNGVRYWIFPSLREMRAEWCKRFGVMSWDNPDEDWAGTPTGQIGSANNVVHLAQR
jgi:hypothetical protein